MTKTQAQNRLKSAFTCYQEWMCEKISPLSLVVFRTLFGFFVFFDMIHFWNNKEIYFNRPEIAFHYPFPFYLPTLPFWAIQGLILLLIVSGLALAVGFLPRLAGFFIFSGLGVLFLEEASFYINHLVLVLFIALLFSWVKMDSFFTLKIEDLRKPKPIYRFETMAFFFLFFSTYLLSAIQKLRPEWFSGEILHANFLMGADRERAVSQHVLALFVDFQPLAIFVLIFELVVPIFLLFRRTRAFAVVLLLVYHVVNHFAFQIGNFSLLMVFAMTLYFDPDWPKRFLPGQKETTV